VSNFSQKKSCEDSSEVEAGESSVSEFADAKQGRNGRSVNKISKDQLITHNLFNSGIFM
jgi:hypothetical protein